MEFVSISLVLKRVRVNPRWKKSMIGKYAGHVAVVCATLLYLPAAFAQDPEASGRWLIHGALDSGIDETVDSGGDTYRIGSTQALGFGYEFVNSSTWITRLSLNYEFNQGDVGDTDNEFSVWPIELLMLYHLGLTRVGFGAGYHAEPVYKADIGDESFEIELDDEFAFIAAVEFEPTKFFSIGARYTYVQYGVSDTRFVFDDGSTEDQLDASSLGVFAVAKF